MPQKTTRPARSSESKQCDPDTDQTGLERIIFFSDAVFAIAITLLALEIRLPTGAGAPTDARLSASLLGMWHKYLAYMISFLVIGTFWMAHHRKFRLIRRYDGTLLILNLLMLMVIAFVPFPSSVISEYGSRAATILYAVTMLIAGLLLAAIWWHASRHNHLTDPHLDARQRRRQFVAPLLTAAVFAVSVGLAFLSNDIARLSWLLILLVTFYANRKEPPA